MSLADAGWYLPSAVLHYPSVRRAITLYLDTDILLWFLAFEASCDGMDWEESDQAVPGYVQEVEVDSSGYLEAEDGTQECEKVAFSLQFKGEHAQPTKDSKPLWSRLSEGTKKELQNKLHQMKVEKQNGDADMKDLKSYIPEIDEAMKTDFQKLPVKKLRKLIPIIRILVYMPEHTYEGKKKLKHLWDETPSDWPATIPFIDPNNGGKSGSGGSSRLSKPGKNLLLKMFSYLKERYILWSKTGRCQPVQEERYVLAPGLSKASEHEVYDSSVDRSTPSPTFTKARSHQQALAQPVHLLSMGTDPAKSLLVRLQPRFEQIRGLGGDHPGMESLRRLELLIESLYQHDKRKFIQLGHDLERLFDELFMMDAKQEDWSKFGEDCKDLSYRWLSSLQLGHTERRPQGVLACHVGEESTSEVPVQNRLVSQTEGPYLPDFNFNEKKADISQTSEFAKEKQPESAEHQHGDFGLQTLGIAFRQPAFTGTDIGNAAKQKSDSSQKGPDRVCDDQNFKHPVFGVLKYCPTDDPMWYSSPDEDNLLRVKAIDEILALEESQVANPLQQSVSEVQTIPRQSLTYTEVNTNPATGATYTVLEAISPTQSAQAMQAAFSITEDGTIVTSGSANNCVILLETGDVTSITPVESPTTTPFFNDMVTEAPATTLVEPVSVPTTPPTTMDTAMLDSILQLQGLSNQELSAEQLQHYISAAQLRQSMEHGQVVESRETEEQDEVKEEPKLCLTGLLPTVVEEMDME